MLPCVENILFLWRVVAHHTDTRSVSEKLYDYIIIPYIPFVSTHLLIKIKTHINDTMVNAADDVLL